MQLKPCARCEQELPLGLFDDPDDMFCKLCTKEVNKILKKKYGVIRAAHIRAQMRLKSRQLRERDTRIAKTG